VDGNKEDEHQRISKGRNTKYQAELWSGRSLPTDSAYSLTLKREAERSSQPLVKYHIVFYIINAKRTEDPTQFTSVTLAPKL
jgi:hypothetical protein